MQFVKISVQKDQTLTGEQASSTSGKIQERDVNFLHQAREGKELKASTKLHSSNQQITLSGYNV